MAEQDRYRPLMRQETFSLCVAYTRLSPKALEIGWDYLVDGMSLKATAKKHGVRPDRVREIVARITQ